LYIVISNIKQQKNTIYGFDIEMIKKVYDNMTTRVDKAREILGHPLTLTEKILYNHLWDGMPSKDFCKRTDYVDFLQME
jgi:aconitate hydratase